MNVWTGEKFGFDAKNTTVTNEEGAEIDSIEVIRDNDKLFIVEEQEFNSVIHWLFLAVFGNPLAVLFAQDEVYSIRVCVCVYIHTHVMIKFRI